jgi:hypothetical protein
MPIWDESKLEYPWYKGFDPGITDNYVKGIFIYDNGKIIPCGSVPRYDFNIYNTLDTLRKQYCDEEHELYLLDEHRTGFYLAVRRYSDAILNMKKMAKEAKIQREQEQLKKQEMLEEQSRLELSRHLEQQRSENRERERLRKLVIVNKDKAALAKIKVKDQEERESFKKADELNQQLTDEEKEKERLRNLVLNHKGTRR